MPVTAALLYNIAATLNAICVPGHVAMGFDTVFPAVETVPEKSSKSVKGKKSAVVGWNLGTGLIAVAGKLTEKNI